jgi:hypothetical protein
MPWQGASMAISAINPKFVQQWSHFIYSILNMDPQLVHNELRNGNYQTLICEYKRVEEGKPGIMYWDVTGASFKRKSVSKWIYMRQPICTCLTTLTLSFC